MGKLTILGMILFSVALGVIFRLFIVTAEEYVREVCPEADVMKNGNLWQISFIHPKTKRVVTLRGFYSEKKAWEHGRNYLLKALAGETHNN